MTSLLAAELKARKAKRAADKAAEARAWRMLAEHDPTRPRLVEGRTMYELVVERGIVRIWSAVGKSGLRWALEPYDRQVAQQPRYVREWCEARLGPAAVERATPARPRPEPCRNSAACAATGCADCERSYGPRR